MRLNKVNTATVSAGGLDPGTNITKPAKILQFFFEFFLLLFFFKKMQVNAAIVSAGGLDPGINIVVREIVFTLELAYNVKRAWGVRCTL